MSISAVTFLHWYQRISAAQAQFEGFQGYKLEQPIPGVQNEHIGGVIARRAIGPNAYLHAVVQVLLDGSDARGEPHVR
ncbi:hypothetical protein KSC_016290 [Ktedonobacter sp. SOSP1-52]|nr:hypothetical protein KSC_016290 [Ktedonobacter sp. SOSP1-52]